MIRFQVPQSQFRSQSLAERFHTLAAEYGPALQRLVRGYEADPALQQDLLQEILVSIWRALPTFEERSSLRTWLYRVAHNVAVSHVIKRGRDRLSRSVALDSDDDQGERRERGEREGAEARVSTTSTLVRNAAYEAEARDQVQRLAALVRALRPSDAQIVLLYMEGLEHAEIAEVTGLTSTNVGVKIHRIRTWLARALQDDSAALAPLPKGISDDHR